MNEQLQAELAAWLGKLREAADAGASFALEQAPLIVQEKVAYGRAVETMWFSLATVAALGTIYGLIRVWRWAYHENKADKTGDSYGFASFCTLFGGGGAATMWAYSVDSLFKVWFAPRLYIVEWLAGLLR